MKKILLTLSLFVGLAVAAFAQGVNVSGTVTDANGSPISNYMVYVMSDSTISPMYFNTVYTDANGVYSDNAGLNTSQGVLYISVIDSCTGTVQSQNVFFSPAQVTFTNVDFSVCTVTPPSCQASITNTTADSLVTFNGSMTGGMVSQYTYVWDFGDGTTATSTTGAMSHIYAANGVYIACVMITDITTGCTSLACDSIGISSYNNGGGSCSAFFTYAITPAGTIAFSASVTGAAPYTYAWDMGDGTTSSSQSVVHTYANQGLYMPCLTVTDASGCISTYCDSLWAPGNGGVCSVFGAISNITGSTVSLNATASGGTSPYTYTWDFGDNTVATGANPTHTYAQVGTYIACVTIVDATGCTSTDCITVMITTPPTSGDIIGLIIHDSVNVIANAQAVVYLIEHDTAAGTLTAIATDTTFTGSFQFTGVPWGQYYVKAALLPSDPYYASYLPTYYLQSLYWSSGMTADVDVNTPVAFALIDLVDGANTGTGPGFIGGLITQGANRTGDPLEGVEVILFDANMNPLTHTVTDQNGQYSFGSLPYGVYYIYVEELGLQTAPIQVTLSPTTPSMDQVHFEVNRNYVAFTSTNTITSINNIKTFPNPVANQLNIQFNAAKMLDIEISVANLIGQVLVQENRIINSGINELSILTNELPAGVYMLNIRSAEGVLTQKIVKQ